VVLWTAPEGTYTIEEFQGLPLEGRRWELLDGAVVQMEMHSARTSLLTGRLLFLIHQHVEEHGLGMTFGPGCGFRLWPGHETVRVTDISVTHHDRIPDKREWDDYPRTAPDLTVEVFSPYERPVTAVGRMAMFLEAGTRLIWFVDPENKTVMLFHPDIAPTMLGEGDTLEGADVLPGFNVQVAEIFAED
jgi:Uma2 family endonuclease